MSVAADRAEFGKIRKILWPIHGYEMMKFVPMFLMFFFVSFNYSLLRIMKDSLVVNAPGSGAECIPFLKLWGTTPAAVIFMMFYLKLASVLTREKLFYAALMPFFAFFMLFPTVLYPNIDLLHPNGLADYLQTVLPEGLGGLIAAFRNWTFSVFYILSELWGSVVLSTMYWGFANEITRVSEAKRFYGLLGIGANIALLFIAPTARFASGLGDWGSSLTFVCGLTAGFTGFIGLLYWYIANRVMVDPRFAPAENEKPKKKKKKKKLGFVASLSELTRSSYLAALAFIVLAYGISINLVEVTWKHNLKLHFAGNSQAFFEFQGLVMTMTGAATIFLLYFGTGNVLRRFGWKTAALLTPTVLLITSCIFFSNIVFSDLMAGVLVMIGTTPLTLVAWAGGIQNMLSKSTKYSFFDPTKELAYIPLDEDMKRTGKAAIDGVGGRLGKSGGSAVNMVLIALLGSIEVIAPFVALATILTGVFWVLSVLFLNKQFVALSGEKTA